MTTPSGDSAPTLVTARMATIDYGPVTLDGFVMPDLTFRQSLRSTAKAIGMAHAQLNQKVLPKLVPGENQVVAGDLSENTPDLVPGENSLLLPVNTGLGGFSAKAQTLDLDTVIAVWGHIARSDSKFSEQACRLLEIGAKVSLEQRYREVFGIKDNRSLQDQLMDAWLDLDSLSHRPLLQDKQLRTQFLRVTGRAIGDRNPYMAVLLSEMIWHRLPPEVLKQMDDLNPVVTVVGTNSTGKDYGFRKHTYSSMLSDQAFKDAVKPIVNTLTGVLSACPNKEQGGYQRALKIMDGIFPRHKNRRGRKLTDSKPQQ